MDWLQSQVRLFRALLYCYPAEFRHEYGAEMEDFFGNRLRAEPRLRLWAETIKDIALSAPREHWSTLAGDLKHGIRILGATPGFTAVALVVTALGIGSAVSIFSLANAVIFRSLPYVQAKNLVYLWSPNANFKGVPQEIGPNVPDFFDWQRLSRSFSGLAGFHKVAVNFVRDGASTRVAATFVTGGFFSTLGASPALGRIFGEAENQPGRQHVAVISYALWRSQFAASPAVLGKKIQLNREGYTVIGIMPPEFGFPFDGDVPNESTGFKQTDLWLPAAYSTAQQTNRTDFDSFDAIGRLRPGVSALSAQAELNAIESRLQPLYPPMWRGWSVLVRPLIATIVGPIEKLFWLLLAAVGLLLLIAVSNVASLLLARASARAHELGIRSALGAERGRLVRQLLTESLLLSCLGGTLGIALAYLAVNLLVKLDPGGIPRFEAARVDVRMLCLAVLLSLAAGLGSGLAPAVFASRTNVNDLLKRAGTRIASGYNRSRSALIALEVALSVILLTASGLLIRSYLHVLAVDPGFSPGALTFRIDVDEHYNKPELRTAFYKTILGEFKRLPAIRSVGASSSLPLSNNESVSFAEIRGFGPAQQVVASRLVTPEYRKTLGIPLLKGRDFDSHDIGSRTPVALVNQRFAQVYLARRDPLGAQIRLGVGDFSHIAWSTVVGVVADVRHNNLEEAGTPQVFEPADSGNNFAIVCDAPVSQVVKEARAALHSVDPVLTLSDVQTMRERKKTSNARRSFQTILLASFAVAAVLLAVTGLYGLMSFIVRQRTAEIGIRVAVGSSRAAIIRLILSQGMRLAALGLLSGMAGAFLAARLLSSSLFGVSAFDPLTFAIVGLLILAVAAGASIIPAWGATRIDPIQALRQE